MKTSVDRSKILKAPYLNVEGLSRDIGKLLLLAPHPDDESLACGGLIALLKESGTHVHIVFVTSGGASHPNSTSHPPHKLARLREKEALAACFRLGLCKEEVSFLREGDSELSLLPDRELDEISFAIIQKFNKGEFSTLAFPWRRDPHADHMVVNNIGRRTLKFIDPEITVLEYPVWLWKKGKGADWPHPGEILPYRLDIEKVVNKKRRAIEEHGSQLGRTVHDDPDGFVLTEELLGPFISPTEYYFLTNRRKSRTLDNGYFEKLYRNNTDPWNFKKSGYEHEKYRRSASLLGKAKFTNALEIGCSVGVHTQELAKKCEHLLAIDINAIAIKEAKHACRNFSHIRFKICDVTQKFPKGRFDLISLCEVGYYFEEEKLCKLFGDIEKSLQVGGKFIMVHWTPYVPVYPLTGGRVHDLFEKFVLEHGGFKEATHERHELYRLQIWERVDKTCSR